MGKYTSKSKIFYLIAFFIFVMFIGLNIVNVLNMEEKLLIAIALISCILVYIAGNISFNKTGNKDILKTNMYIYFAFYLVLLCFFMFISPIWGRGIYLFSNNLIPFKTIKTYLTQFDSLYNTKIILNLIGNFVCIMPFAFFVKYLFKNKYKILLILAFVVGAEIIQFLTGSGVFDIDDIILNSGGAILLYGLLNINFIDKAINWIFFKTGKISKKEIIPLAMLVLLIFFSFIFITKYRENLYDKNLDELNAIRNPSIKFVYDDKCSNNNKKFYEDEIYEYYFDCIDADEIYIIVNEKEQMSITELLDGSKYEISIENFVYKMKEQKIGYNIKHKYQFFELEIERRTDSYSEEAFLTNEYAKLVFVEQESKSDDSFIREVNIIPYKEGSTIRKISFEFYDNSGSVVKIVNKYIQIDIDKDLNVIYKIIE